MHEGVCLELRLGASKYLHGINPWDHPGGATKSFFEKLFVVRTGDSEIRFDAILGRSPYSAASAITAVVMLCGCRLGFIGG